MALVSVETVRHRDDTRLNVYNSALEALCSLMDRPGWCLLPLTKTAGDELVLEGFVDGYRGRVTFGAAQPDLRLLLAFICYRELAKPFFIRSDVRAIARDAGIERRELERVEELVCGTLRGRNMHLLGLLLTFGVRDRCVLERAISWDSIDRVVETLQLAQVEGVPFSDLF